MALILSPGYPGNAGGVDNMSSMAFTTDAGAPASSVINVGYQPRYVKLVNITDLVTSEFFDGMPIGNCLQESSAGAKSLVTTGLTIDRNNVTISAALLPASKSFYLVAFA